jgi:hypothetical protein
MMTCPAMTRSRLNGAHVGKTHYWKDEATTLLGLAGDYARQAQLDGDVQT